ncbi:hypothetical protein K456DRAFT_896151 [Colletotrichum gloeosporioides 23]|nr:hypothetical protein K456DRAFT_896151 [Colletotrichum gloeosporioides 23]
MVTLSLTRQPRRRRRALFGETFSLSRRSSATNSVRSISVLSQCEDFFIKCIIMLLLGSFQYYLLRSPRTAEQFQQYKLFAILRLGKLLPPSRPQEPTTSNNHALLRMMYVRIPCQKEHETRRKQVCTGAAPHNSQPN